MILTALCWHLVKIASWKWITFRFKSEEDAILESFVNLKNQKTRFARRRNTFLNKDDVDGNLLSNLITERDI